MEAAGDAARAEARRIRMSRPLIIAVTILTSMDLADLVKMGLASVTSEQLEAMSKHEQEAFLGKMVVKLAKLAKEAGLDGVVASANHAAAIRKACGKSFVIITPGIRFAKKEAAGFVNVGDQKQVATPGSAAQDGADMLVIGRAITDAPDPESAVQRATEEIRQALPKAA